MNKWCLLWNCIRVHTFNFLSINCIVYVLWLVMFFVALHNSLWEWYRSTYFGTTHLCLKLVSDFQVLQGLTSPLKVIITHPIPHFRCLLDFLLNNRRWKMLTFWFPNTCSLGLAHTSLEHIHGQLLYCFASESFWCFYGWQGFDEYMNLVLEDAEEVNIKKKSRKSLGNYILIFSTLLLFMRALRYMFYVLQEGFFLKETTLLWWWTRKLNQNSLCPPQQHHPPPLICS